jgi:hypothetical protein
MGREQDCVLMRVQRQDSIDSDAGGHGRLEQFLVSWTVKTAWPGHTAVHLDGQCGPRRHQRMKVMMQVVVKLRPYRPQSKAGTE